MRCLLKAAKVLAITLLFVQVGWAGRWEKGLKINGWSNTYTQYDYWEWRLGANGDFVYSMPSSLWANQVRISYGEKSNISYENKQISMNNLTLAEVYNKRLSPFVYWEAYAAFGGSLTNFTKDIGSEYYIVYGKNFTRYLRASAGLEISKRIQPDESANYWVRVSMGYERTIGYRTKLGWFPVAKVKIPTQSGEKSYTKLIQDIYFTYKLGKKLDFTVNLTTGYDYNPDLADNSRLYRKEEINLVYDVFQY